MLRIILLSLVWAVCATFLVRLWFWKGVIQKDIFNNDKGKIGFNRILLNDDIAKQIIIFLETFAASIIMYTLLGLRENLYGSFFMIILCLVFQLLWKNQRKIHYVIIITGISICAILWIQDGIAGYIIDKKDNILASSEFKNNTKAKCFISSKKKLRIILNEELPKVYNDDYMLYMAKSECDGKGIVIVNKDDYAVANFIPYTDNELTGIRITYPTQKLKEIGVVILNDITPYEVYEATDKTWLLGKYNISGYMVLNCNTGEYQMLTKYELIDFVADN